MQDHSLSQTPPVETYKPKSDTGLFIVWRIFQRRTESLSAIFNLEVKYYYFPWEEKTRAHKAWSYFCKTVLTLKDLFRIKPSVIFVQLPPTPVLYIASVFCRLTKSKLVADCHNAMIYSKWLEWPFAKSLLRNADTLLVHNHDVEAYAKTIQLDAITLHDPLPRLTGIVSNEIATRFAFTDSPYVIVPWSFAADEPIHELIQAAASMPETVFVMTWFAERLPTSIRENLPSNLVLTGYLGDADFTSVFARASAALVLTTREGTQPSGATEAIALGVPLILSDLKTTRRLYEDMPIYIENTVHGILQGVRQAFADLDTNKRRVKAFRDTLSTRLAMEIADVKSMLGIFG